MKINENKTENENKVLIPMTNPYINYDEKIASMIE